MDAVGINEPFRTRPIGVIYLIERGVPVRDDERILIALGLKHRGESAVQSLDEQIAEVMQTVERDLELLFRKSVARLLFDERGVNVHDGVVDGLEDYERIRVEAFERVHYALDVFHRAYGRHITCGVPVQNAIDGGVFALCRLQNDVVHGDGIRLERAVLPILQDVVAEDGNVDDVRLGNVQEQSAGSVIIEFVLKDSQQILGEMSGYGMVVIDIIVASSQHVGVGVFLPEPQRRGSEYTLRYGVAEIDDLLLVGRNGIVVARDERSDATRRHDEHEQRQQNLSFHKFLLMRGGRPAPPAPLRESTDLLYNIAPSSTIVENRGFEF